MRLRPARIATTATLAALFLAAAAVPAIADDSPPAPSTAAERLALAKDLFRKGVALLDADDVERALDYFLRSRAAVPSAKNTANAAICLSRLGRYDEALEMYEELLVKFSADLDQEDRQTLGPAMAALREKVGGVSLSANVDGLVVIDGRSRGRLPFNAPVRVLGGKHVIRIFKDGYAAFETRVDVTVGATVPLDARLAPLAGAGLLRVDDPAAEGFDVFVDGSVTGRVPWEGTIGLGRHLVWIQKGDRGSAPGSIVVLEGQTALAQLTPSPLGPPLRIDVTPPEADIAIDGVTLGERRWEGRLPIGAHRIMISEDGYKTRSIPLVVQNGSLKAEQMRLALTVDPDSPRWPRPARGRLTFGVFGGYIGATTLHSDAEAACPARCFATPGVSGYFAGIRAAFRLKLGLAPELSAGFMSFGASVDRGAQTTFLSRQTERSYAVSYRLSDPIHLSGAMLGVGMSFRAPIKPYLGILARTTVGALLSRATDPITGTAGTDGPTVPISVSNRDEVLPATLPFVMPEIGAQFTVGSFLLGASVGAAFFPFHGPRFSHTDTGVAPQCEVTHPGGVGCAPIANLVSNERAYGAFALFTPQLEVGYTF
jgi:PEGA domain